MKVHVHVLWLFLLICCCKSGYGQEQLTNQLSDLIETLQEDFPELQMEQEMLDELHAMAEHPMNINTSTKEALKRLPFLTDRLIENLHYYIYQFGPMISLYELKGVEGFDQNLIKNTIPFVSVKEEASFFKERNQKARLGNEILFRSAGTLQRTLGFENKEALGSPGSCLIRNKLSYGKYTWMLVSEKDPGEAFIYNKKPAFISSALQYVGSGIVRKVIFGDYKIHFGQGLIQSSNLFNRKSALIISDYGTQKLRFSTSADGGWFKRGAVVHLGRQNFEAIVFGARQKMDATVYDDTIQRVSYFKSIQNGGYHRTLLEYNKRNAVCLSEYGGSLQYTNNRTKVSLQGNYNTHNLLFMRDERLYSDWWNMSLSVGGILGNVHWWMESGTDKAFNLSGIAGGDVYLDKSFGLSVVGRYLSADFYSFYGNVFSEGGSPANEQGIYLGMIMNPTGAISIRTYIDVFKFPVATYNASVPSAGWEFLCQAEGKKNMDLEWIAKFKFEEKAQDVSGTAVTKTFMKHKYDGKFALAYPVNDFTFKSVVQCSRYVLREQDEYGWMFYQDLKGCVFGNKVKWNGRVAFFSTPSYDTRLYAYENDVLYAFSVPAHYGKGVRYAFNLSYKFKGKMTLYAKYGCTIYSDREIISSGFTEIQGNVKSELKFQLRYRL